MTCDGRSWLTSAAHMLSTIVRPVSETEADPDSPITHEGPVADTIIGSDTTTTTMTATTQNDHDDAPRRLTDNLRKIQLNLTSRGKDLLLDRVEEILVGAGLGPGGSGPSGKAAVKR